MFDMQARPSPTNLIGLDMRQRSYIHHLFIIYVISNFDRISYTVVPIQISAVRHASLCSVVNNAQTMK